MPQGFQRESIALGRNPLTPLKTIQCSSGLEACVCAGRIESKRCLSYLKSELALLIEDRVASYCGTAPETLTCPHPDCNVIETTSHFIHDCPAEHLRKWIEQHTIIIHKPWETYAMPEQTLLLFQGLSIQRNAVRPPSRRNNKETTITTIFKEDRNCCI